MAPACRSPQQRRQQRQAGRQPAARPRQMRWQQQQQTAWQQQRQQWARRLGEGRRLVGTAEGAAGAQLRARLAQGGGGRCAAPTHPTDSMHFALWWGGSFVAGLCSAWLPTAGPGGRGRCCRDGAGRGKCCAASLAGRPPACLPAAGAVSSWVRLSPPSGVTVRRCAAMMARWCTHPPAIPPVGHTSPGCPVQHARRGWRAPAAAASCCWQRNAGVAGPAPAPPAQIRPGTSPRPAPSGAAQHTGPPRHCGGRRRS